MRGNWLQKVAAMVHVSSVSKLSVVDASRRQATEPGHLRVLAAVADDITLAEIRNSCSGCRIVESVKDGWSMLSAADRCSPDLIVADLDMQGLDGIEAAARLRRTHPELMVIIVASETAYELVEEAFEAGAAAYVLKRELARDLARAIIAVFEGERFVSSGSPD
jgi:DNA-binding NarL/FixJ family response regulator